MLFRSLALDQTRLLALERSATQSYRRCFLECLAALRRQTVRVEALEKQTIALRNELRSAGQ